MNPEIFRLTPEERASPLWLRLVQRHKEKLDSLRKSNDEDKDPVQTAKMRGRIAEINEFLSLDNPPPISD